MTRPEALTALLALPDPPGMVRAYHYTLGRDPLRDPWQIKKELGTAYVERRRQERGVDISCIVSLRRQTKLRMVG